MKLKKYLYFDHFSADDRYTSTWEGVAHGNDMTTGNLGPVMI